MLSEHTLKAIDIVCGEVDAKFKERVVEHWVGALDAVCEEIDVEFKKQITEHLEIFYKQMQQEPMVKCEGLCSNLHSMLGHCSAAHYFCNKVLSKSFEIAGLDVSYPFNSGDRNEYYTEKEHYENPNRFAWIAENNA